MIAVRVDPIATLTSPWIDDAERRIRDVLFDRELIAPQPILDGIVDRLRREVGALVTWTVVDEFDRFRRDNDSAADPASDRAIGDFDAVVRQVIADRYPELVRRVDAVVTGRIEQVDEVLNALAADHDSLGITTPVDSLDFGHGDPHEGGRRVVMVGAGSHRMVYKPRSGDPDLLLHQLVEVVDCGVDASDALSVPDVLARDGYSWHDCRAPHDIVAAGGARRFHRRLGRLLALFSAIGTTDMHVENIVAAGEYPVPIDVETLLHPSTDGSVLGDGPLGTGMLPSGSDAVSGTCIAAVSPAGRRTVDGSTTRVLAHDGTDAMTLVSEPTIIELSSHRPHVAGVPVPIENHIDDIVDGYLGGVASIRFHENDIRSLLDSAAGTEFRRVVRPTAVYGAFLDASTHPRYLTGRAERRRLFDMLPATTTGGDEARDLEVDALCVGDVPRFVGPAGAATLRAGDCSIDAASTDTALARAHRCLTRTTRTNPVAAEHTIRSALAGIAESIRPHSERVRGDDLHRALIDRDARRSAARVARRVAARAVRDSSDVVHALPAGSGSVLVASDRTLYHGGGVALFSGRRSDLDPVIDARYRLEYPEPDLCPFTGALGTVWMLRESTRATASDHALADAVLAATLERVDVENYDRLDVVGGLAGATALLATTDWVGPEFLERCCERLAGHLSLRESSPRGLAHGIDGTAWAVARASRVLGTDRYDAAIGWVLDHPPTPADAGWCWGAAGLAMAHTEIADRLGRSTPSDLADAAKLPDNDDTLCHGGAGTVLALRHIATMTGRDDRYREVAAELQNRIARSGYATGHSHHVGALGFMTGVPGIAYARLLIQGDGAGPDCITLTASRRAARPPEN
jgi:type 2 lantibiotic biosynthesis protein LanM